MDLTRWRNRRLPSDTEVDKIVRVTSHSRSTLRVQAFGATAVLGSALLPWFSARGPTVADAPALRQLTVAPWVIVGLTALCLGSLAIGRRRPSNAPRYVAAGSAALLLIVPSVTMVLLNVAALWIAPNFLPRTWRRVLIGVSPSSGTWLAMVGGALLIVAVLDRCETFESTVRSVASGLLRFRRESIGALLALAAVVAILSLRYRPWFSLTLTALHGSPVAIALPGYAVPFVGIAGLFLAVAAGAAAVAGSVRPHPLVGGTLVTVGWMSAAPAAIAAALGVRRVGFHLTLPDVVRQSLAQWSRAAHRDTNGSVALPTLARHVAATFGGGSGALLTAIASVILCLAGIMLVKPATREMT